MKTSNEKNPLFYILLLLIGMLSIQSGSSLAKSLFSQLNPQGVTTLRLFFATLILLPIVRPWRYKITASEVKTISLYGISLGLMNLTFYLALERIPLGIAVALEFVGPLGVALFLSRSLRDLIWVVFAAAGIILLLPIAPVASSLDPIGIAYALSAGVFWGLYIIFGQTAGAALPHLVISNLGMLAAGLVVLPFGLFAAGTTMLNFSVLPYAIGVGFLSGALPYPLEMIALKNLPRKSFSILMSLEPCIASLVGILFLDETLTPSQWLAIGLIIMASVGITASRRKAVPPPLV